MAQAPSSLSGSDDRHRGREGSMVGDKGGSSVAYGASNMPAILPM
jgi:hypothetical protein